MYRITKKQEQFAGVTTDWYYLDYVFPNGNVEPLTYSKYTSNILHVLLERLCQEQELNYEVLQGILYLAPIDISHVKGVELLESKQVRR